MLRVRSFNFKLLLYYKRIDAHKALIFFILYSIIKRKVQYSSRPSLTGRRYNIASTGTSVKFLVFALIAQIGVGAES